MGALLDGLLLPSREQVKAFLGWARTSGREDVQESRKPVGRRGNDVYIGFAVSADVWALASVVMGQQDRQECRCGLAWKLACTYRIREQDRCGMGSPSNEN